MHMLTYSGLTSSNYSNFSKISKMKGVVCILVKFWYVCDRVTHMYKILAKSQKS